MVGEWRLNGPLMIRYGQHICSLLSAALDPIRFAARGQVFSGSHTDCGQLSARGCIVSVTLIDVTAHGAATQYPLHIGAEVPCWRRAPKACRKTVMVPVCPKSKSPCGPVSTPAGLPQGSLGETGGWGRNKIRFGVAPCHAPSRRPVEEERNRPTFLPLRPARLARGYAEVYGLLLCITAHDPASNPEGQAP
jgi:hypothetical protein